MTKHALKHQNIKAKTVLKQSQQKEITYKELAFNTYKQKHTLAPSHIWLLKLNQIKIKNPVPKSH